MKLIAVFALILCLSQWAYADNQAGGELAPIVVEASRSNDTAGEMNKDVSIITSEDIANAPSKSLPELLSAVPGIEARVNSNIKDTQIDMGQFGEVSSSNVLILIDGRRLNKPDIGATDLALIDLNAVDHIEVIHGAATVLYGDNAVGGVINIVTKKGAVDTRPTVTLNSETGSYKTNKEGVEVNGGLSKLTYQFNYDRRQSNNYRTNDNYWADDFNTHLAYNPTDLFGVDFTQGYHLDRYRLPGGLSIDDYTDSLGNLIHGINEIGPTGANPFIFSYGTTSDSHFDVTPHLKFDMGKSQGEFSIFTSARKSITNAVFPPSDNFPESLNYEEEAYEFQPKLIVSTPLTDRLDNKLTTGYDYIYYREKRRINSPGSAEDVVFANEASQGVYLLDELALDEHWLLNAGARGSWAQYVFDISQPSSLKDVRSPTTEGFDGGLGYKYNHDSKIFVDYTRSYRLPKIDEFFENPFPWFPVNNSTIFNAGLSYQKGNQYQIGIRDNTFKDVHMGFTATEVQYKNEIFDDPNTGVDANYNGRTRNYSEEADISVDLLRRKITPFANVTFQQTRFVGGDFSGSQIPDVPDHLAHAGITFRPLEGLSTSFIDNFVGKRFGQGDDANVFPKVKRYDTVDWNIKYDYKNLELWLSLNNIFNTRYFEYGSSYGPVFGSGPELYYPGPGRNVEAGVKVTF